MSLELEEKAYKLTNLWNNLVQQDHHKDRDCHWYINKVWSYGQRPIYRVEHYGYVGSEYVSKDYKTYQEALQCMIDYLIQEFKNQFSFAFDKTYEEDYNDIYKKQIRDMYPHFKVILGDK